MFCSSLVCEVRYNSGSALLEASHVGIQLCAEAHVFITCFKFCFRNQTLGTPLPASDAMIHVLNMFVHCLFWCEGSRRWRPESFTVLRGCAFAFGIGGFCCPVRFHGPYLGFTDDYLEKIRWQGLLMKHFWDTALLDKISNVYEYCSENIHLLCIYWTWAYLYWSFIIIIINKM